MIAGSARRILALPLALAACGPTKSDGATAGQETGPCLDNTCASGLVCFSNLCIDPDEPAPSTTTGGLSMSGASDTPSTASTPTTTDPSTTAGPTTSPPGTTTGDPGDPTQPPTLTADPDPSATEPATSSPGTTTSTTGEPSGFGNCGWVVRAKYYACAADGAVPGLVDPDGISPIACADNVVEGDACKDLMPVDEIGCCTPDGVLFYCDTQTDPNAPTVFRQECGV